MDYREYRFEISPLFPARDILIAELDEMGFDSFVEEDFGLLAYTTKVDEVNEEIEALAAFSLEGAEISYSTRLMPRENWNAKWESSFQPIDVDGLVYVRAPFHEAQTHYGHELVIQPKMSFGTGHHDTTWLMLREMMEIDFSAMTVLDMGSGTGILAIMAEQQGAEKVDAIDIDDWAEENARENAAMNNCKRITCYTGDASLLGNQKYDVILANINRNVLTTDMSNYAAVLKKDGFILFSGFFESDAQVISECAANKGLKRVTMKVRNDWCCLKFVKA